MTMSPVASAVCPCLLLCADSVLLLVSPPLPSLQIAELQRNAVISWQVKEAKISERRQLHDPDDVYFYCVNCNVAVCCGSDIRTVEGMHHVNINPNFRSEPAGRGQLSAVTHMSHRALCAGRAGVAAAWGRCSGEVTGALWGCVTMRAEVLMAFCPLDHPPQGVFWPFTLQALLHGLAGENKLPADVQGLGARVPRHVQRVQAGEQGHRNPPLLAPRLCHSPHASAPGQGIGAAFPFSTCLFVPCVWGMGAWVWVAVPWDVPWEEGAASSTQPCSLGCCTTRC